ncbi:hypothetical protein BS78_03G230600 [Paspalum vaginatum]|nr:hypothetical protein BS78_03G230600 [Paspalum vaginatum]
MPHLPTKMAAAHSSGACRLCVLFLLLSGAILSAATSTQDSPLCPMPSPAPQNQPGGKDAHLELLSSLELNAGYFYGGEDIHFTKDDSNETSPHVTRSFSLLPLNVDSTADPALHHVTATLVLSGGRARHHFYAGAHRRRRHDYVGGHSVTFHFQGYYSTAPGSASADLCMAGSGYYSEEDGSSERLRDVALHLLVPNPPSITHPFVTGRLKGAGFETISLVAYAEGDAYRYGESASSCSPPPSTARRALQALGANFSCAHLKEHLETSYKLQYGGGASSSWPLMGLQALRMHMGQVQCATDGAVRAYAAFSNDTTTDGGRRRRRRLQRPPFMFNDEVVVAEGRWNATDGVLCLRACRVPRSSGISPSTEKPECRIGMSFWLPRVWTIRDRSAVAGMLWNSTQVATPGNGVSGVVVSASSIDFNVHRSNFSDIKYNYNNTMIEEAKKHHHDILKKQRKVKGSSFLAPNYTYHDFEFRFYNDRGFGHGRGDAYPISLGSTMVYGDRLVADDSFSRSRDAVVDVRPEELLNVSYDIREFVPPAGWVPPKNGSYSITLQARQMRAEGVFDPKTGILCLVACREYNDSTTDCQILITVQFASLDGKAQVQGHGRGAISSLRNKTTNDPLFFEKADIGLYGMYSEQVFEEISRMDVESILLVISTTLPCVFTALQILHAKRKPEAAAATSITMLVVLALGYVAPLVVSSEALFMSRRRGYVPLLPFRSYVPYELSQAMMRAPTLIALLLQLRLIQLAWSARKETTTDAADRSMNAESGERRALWVCVPLYLIGGALTVIVHVVNARRAARENSLTVPVGPEQATLLEDLVSSGGLALDAFLLPQVAMNALSPGPGAGVVRALSPWFYIGGTVVRAMPHVYDVVRAQGYVPSIKPSYVYASPRYDRFGIAWDVVVPCGAALLAVLLFLQQQRVRLAAPLFRSRRRLGEYEMVSPESPL